MVIDSHQHFWKYEPVKHGWINHEMRAIRKDFMPSDLQKVYVKHDIDGCVAVQADQTLEEMDFLLQLASENEFIKGVVGWADLRGNNIEAVLEKYSQSDKLKGFRHIVQGEADHNFLLRGNFLKGISVLEKHNYTYDILVFPHQLCAVLEFVKRFPNQNFVIDHIAKPYIKDGFFEGWATLMKAIAKHENVFCKVSGMITETDYKTWSQTQLQPYLDLVFSAFGTRRTMYGSDWPVCLVAGNYQQVKNVVTNYISHLSETEQQAVMGKNAIQFYNL